MISPNAIDWVDAEARRIGYSSRSEHERAAAVSAGDYKGDSTVVVAFSTRHLADSFASQCGVDLAAVGGDMTVRVVDLGKSDYTGDDNPHAVVIRGTDLLTRWEIDEQRESDDQP